MKDIKFRAWDNTQNKMLVVLNGVNDEDCIPDGTLPYADVSEWPEVYELMQFTGLTDKKGKEIFEGDVVKYECEDDLKVENGKVITAMQTFLVPIAFKDGMFQGEWKNGRGRVSWELARNLKQGEVIGNIYQSPELLQGEE